MPDAVDDELRVTAALAAQRRDELVAEGQPGLAEFMNELAATAADRRAEHRALRREVEDAMFPSVDITDTLEQDPPDLERERRLSAATAERQAGKAKQADTKLVCPKGHFCGARVWHTSTGLLFTASAPPRQLRSSNPRRVPFATLVDGAGGYDLECTRCEGRSCHFDMGEVRRAVLAGARLHFAT